MQHHPPVSEDLVLLLVASVAPIDRAVVIRTALEFQEQLITHPTVTAATYIQVTAKPTPAGEGMLTAYLKDKKEKAKSRRKKKKKERDDGTPEDLGDKGAPGC